MPKKRHPIKIRMSDYTPAGRQGLQKQITRITGSRDPLAERIITCCYRVYTGLEPKFVVENEIIVEVKAVSGNIPDVFKYQVLSYLKASALKVNFLVNFDNKSCRVKRLTF